MCGQQVTHGPTFDSKVVQWGTDAHLIPTGTFIDWEPYISERLIAREGLYNPSTILNHQMVGSFQFGGLKCVSNNIMLGSFYLNLLK